MSRIVLFVLAAGVLPPAAQTHVADDTFREVLARRCGDDAALGLVVDTASADAVRLVQDAVSGVPTQVEHLGAYFLLAFQRSSLAGEQEVELFRHWARFRDAVLHLGPDPQVPRVHQVPQDGRDASEDAVDAVMEVARVAPEGARILVVSGAAISPRAKDLAVQAQAMRASLLQVDVWWFGGCDVDPELDALRGLVGATGGSVHCDPASQELTAHEEVTLAARRDLVGPLHFLVDAGVSKLRLLLSARAPIYSAAVAAPGGRTWEVPIGETSAAFTLDLDARHNATTAADDAPSTDAAVWTLTVSSDAPIDAEVRALRTLTAPTASPATLAPAAAVADDAQLPSTGGGNGPAEGTSGAVQLFDRLRREIRRSKRSAADTSSQQGRQFPQNDEAELLDSASHSHHHTSLGSPSLVETAGHGNHGDIITKLSNLTQAEAAALIQPPVIIELAQRTQLNVQPGQTMQLNFELTNNRELPIRFEFRLRDDRRYLRTMRPIEAVVAPQQTVTIEATIIVRQNAPEGETDKVTLTARSPFEATTKSAMIYVGQQYTTDYTYPSVWWSWKSVCKGAWDTSNCHTNTWTVDFTIQDKESGLLSVSTIPRGIQYREEFVSGTREPVKAFYSASCCAKKVDLTVTDVQGNILRQTYDVGTQFLGDAEIASIALGILVIILLVAVIILAICLCRRRESRRLERSHLGSRH